MDIGKRVTLHLNKQEYSRLWDIYDGKCQNTFQLENSPPLYDFDNIVFEK
jgi:hypothetical protein